MPLLGVIAAYAFTKDACARTVQKRDRGVDGRSCITLLTASRSATSHRAAGGTGRDHGVAGPSTAAGSGDGRAPGDSVRGGRARRTRGRVPGTRGAGRRVRVFGRVGPPRRRVWPRSRAASHLCGPCATRGAQASGVRPLPLEMASRKGTFWPLEKGPPFLSCGGRRDVAGRSGATGGQVATSAIGVAPPVACGTRGCVWRP